MTKKERLQQIIDHFCDGNKTNFGIRVGIGNSSVHSWLSRDTFDAFLIAEKFPEIDCKWLLTGKGQMLLGEEHAQEEELDEETLPVRILKSQLEEKDKQIYKMLGIIEKLKS